MQPASHCWFNLKLKILILNVLQIVLFIFEWFMPMKAEKVNEFFRVTFFFLQFLNDLKWIWMTPTFCHHSCPLRYIAKPLPGYTLFVVVRFIGKPRRRKIKIFKSKKNKKKLHKSMNCKRKRWQSVYLFLFEKENKTNKNFIL